MNDINVDEVTKDIRHILNELADTSKGSPEDRKAKAFDIIRKNVIETSLYYDDNKANRFSLPTSIMIEMLRIVNIQMFFQEFVGKPKTLNLDDLMDYIEDTNKIPSDFKENHAEYTKQANRFTDMMRQDLETTQKFMEIGINITKMEKDITLAQENLDNNAWRMAYNFTNILLNEEQQQAGKKVYDEYYLLDNTGDIELQSISESYLHIVDTLARLYAWQDFKLMIGKAYEINAIIHGADIHEIDTQAYNVLKTQSKRLVDYIFHVRFANDVNKKHDENIRVDAPVIRELLDKYRPIMNNTDFNGVKRLPSKDFTNIYKKNKDTLLNDPEQLQSVYSAIKDKIMVNYKQWESHYRKYDKSYKGV